MEVLLDKAWSFVPADTATNVIVPFTVPRDFDHLEFVFSYGPKVVDDPVVILREVTACMEKYVAPADRPKEIRVEDFDKPVNFVTLSIDCGDEYIGCAHRHPPEGTIRIGAEDATFGFFRHPASAGAWRVVLNVHAVMAGTVDYHLTITGKEAGEA